MHDRAWRTRKKVCELVTEPSVLQLVAQEDPHAECRKAAARQWLAVIAGHGDAETCLALMSTFTDQAVLEMIVETFGLAILTLRISSISVSAEIARKISDAAAERLVESADPLRLAEFSTAKEFRIRAAAVGRLTDQKVLAKIAWHDPHAEIKSLAIERLTDQSFLAGIATKHPFRRWVVKRLRDQSLISQIAQNDADFQVRHEAVKVLMDQPALASIATKDPEAFIRVDAVKNLADQKLLRKISNSDPEKYVREAACERIFELTLQLLCIKCSRLYSIGKDAIIVTKEDVRGLVPTTIDFANGSIAVREDLVSGIENTDLERREGLLRTALQRAKFIIQEQQLLAPESIGHWICRKCEQINKYSAIEADPQFSLHQAIANRHFDVAEGLIKRGAEVNARLPAGMTPLHLAAVGGNSRIVVSLLVHRADPELRDIMGRIPLDLAKMSKNSEAEHILSQLAQFSALGIDVIGDIAAFVDRTLKQQNR